MVLRRRPVLTLTYRPKTVNSFSRAGRGSVTAVAAATSSTTTAINRLVRMPGRNDARQLLEALRPNPAYVLSRTNDLLDANPAGFQLLPGLAEWPARQRNTIRYTFLHPAARALWPDWEQKARGCVAHLHAVAGADPDAPDLAAIIGELIVKSPDFSRLWDRYEVRRMGDGEKVFRHPAVGTMSLAHESLELTRTDGQRLVVYMAAPGTADYDAMVLLDMAGFAGAASTPDGGSYDSGVSHTQ